MVLGLAWLAGPLATALAVQPLRQWRSPAGRGMLLLLAPVAMAVQAGLTLALLAGTTDGAATPDLKLAAAVALHAVLALPAALLAALLLARTEPRGLHQALAVVGVSPMARFGRLTLPAVLPGVLLGWVVGLVPSFVAVTGLALPRMLAL